MEPIKFGVGRLTWNRTERVSDRYGTVYLIPDEKGLNSFSTKKIPSIVDEAAARRLESQSGTLFCNVIATRTSPHIGDLFRSIFPRQPDVGATIMLGEGQLFVQPAYGGGVEVGLKPSDGRQNDWLDPHALYNVHDQTVELFFQPVEPSA